MNKDIKITLINILEHYQWRYVGLDHLKAVLYERGDVRIAIDDYGLFIYIRNDNRWLRIAGLSNACLESPITSKLHCLWPIWLGGYHRQTPWQLNLQDGRLVQERPKL